MDKIQKVLRKLRPKEQEAMLLLMEQLKIDYKKVPNLVPIKNKKGWFRVRMGNYRILFELDSDNKTVKVRKLTRRDERTYKDLGADIGNFNTDSGFFANC